MAAASLHHASDMAGEITAVYPHGTPQARKRTRRRDRAAHRFEKAHQKYLAAGGTKGRKTLAKRARRAAAAKSRTAFGRARRARSAAAAKGARAFRTFTRRGAFR